MNSSRVAFFFFFFWGGKLLTWLLPRQTRGVPKVSLIVSFLSSGCTIDAMASLSFALIFALVFCAPFAFASVEVDQHTLDKLVGGSNSFFVQVIEHSWDRVQVRIITSTLQPMYSLFYSGMGRSRQRIFGDPWRSRGYSRYF